MTVARRCGDKTRYHARHAAEVALWRVRGETRTAGRRPPQRVYHCPTCGDWQLTSRPHPRPTHTAMQRSRR